MKKILLLALCLISINVSASHIAGGSITYKWITGNDFEITLELIADCQGITPANSANISIESQTTFFTFNTTVNQVGLPQELNLICSSSASQSSCNGGALPSYKLYTYTGTVSLPSSDSWKMSYEDCCRNGSITTLMNPASQGFRVEALLDNTNLVVNNSPQFNNDAVMILYANQPVSLNYSATETDGDSIGFEFQPSLDMTSAFVTYNAPYTYSNPFSSSSAISINNNTGVITATPNQLQVFVMAVKVSEYRNGILIGWVMRDIQCMVINGANNLPQLTGINGTTNFITNTCANQTLSFTVNSSDADVTQQLSVSYDSLINNASISFSGGLNPTTTFSWSPTIADVSSNPYLVTFSVLDDNCPYIGIQSYTYQVYVNTCPADTVWPGDANSDLIVNAFDVLSIGLAYGETGATRIAATTNWVGQYCTDWSNYFISGINHKHADCNGDGIVDTTDLDAVTINNGLTHLKLEEPNHANDRSLPDLTVQLIEDTVGAGSLVHGTISLTDGGNNIADVYGVAIELSFNSAIIDYTSLNAAGNGWLNNNTGFITWKKSGNGKINFVFVRENHLGITGQGLIADFDFLIPSGAFTSLEDITITDARIITNTGAEVQVNWISDVVFVSGFDNILNINDLQFSVFPNPANDQFTVSSNQNISAIKITDIVGRIILKKEVNEKELIVDIEKYYPGQYIIEITVNGMSEQKSFIKM